MSSKQALAAYLKANLKPDQIITLRRKYGKANDYAKYASDPVGFARDVLKLHLWSKQQDILRALCGYRSRVSARSCHGIGKTLTSAVAVLWFLYCHKPARVVVTATKQDQLKLGVWYEVKRLHERCGLAGQCDTLKLTLSTDQIAVGQTARDATSFQGQHCAHILVIVDEAAGVSEEIFTGVDALLTSEDARLLMLGNPTSSSGRFYDSHHSLCHLYTCIAVSAFDTPAWTNEEVPEVVLKSLINKSWVEEKTEEWGKDSPLYASRILGQFPSQAEDALIDLTWLDQANGPKEADEDHDVEFGVDMSRLGQAETCVYVRKGPNILEMQVWHGRETTYSEGRIVELARKHNPRVIRIDDGGVGGGPVDHLKELGLPAIGVNAGSRTTNPDAFVLMRDETWWTIRELLRKGEIGGLTDEKTRAQLSAIKYTYDSRGRVKIESKDEMKKRGLKSPDRADSLCLAFHNSQPHAAAAILEFEPELSW